MENNSNSVEDIRTIRRLMEESSRFLSLSGLSGVFAGLFAIAGALVAYFLILKNGTIHYDEYFRSMSEKETLMLRWELLTDAALVLILALTGSLYFSLKKAKRDGKSLWTPVSRRMLLNMFIPLVTGGFFVLILLIQNHIQLIVPGLLVFYGLALVSAGKFTYGEVFFLGISEIVTGLVSAFFPAQGLLFWIIGFGILHIVYGLLLYRKYGA
jgi:hypothetical protein